MKYAAATIALVAAALHAAPARAKAIENGSAAAAETPICTDRPTKASVACTVPTGAVQIESDAINWTRFSSGGIDTETILYTNPTIKYGLGVRTDIEANIAPYESVHTHGQGVDDTLHGVGDLYLRLKQRLTASDAKTQIAFIPYVKAPTARSGIGNRMWEGGAVVPVIFSLPSGFALNFSPEIDVLADGDGSGHHVNLTSLANLSHAVGKKGTIYAEFWNSQNFDPARTIHQYSADVAYAYLLSPRLQLDLGANFGLNRFTPDSQVYLGISTRF